MDAASQSAGVTSHGASAKRNALQVLEGSYTASLSNTVCISAADGEWLSASSKAMEEFCVYGDIARVDLNLMVMLKCVLLTFFDVRSSQQVLMNMIGRAEPFPSSAHDCRIVRVKMAAFFEKMPMLAMSGGFAHFGEVAHIAMSGGDAFVEYYDIRSAQMLLAAAGSTASPWMLASQGLQPEQLSSALSVSGAARGTGLEGLGAMLSGGCASLMGGLLGKAVRAAGAGGGPDAGVGAPRSPPGLYHGNQVEEGCFTGCDSSPTTATTSTGGAMTSSNSESNEPFNAERGAARPNRTKVTTKEFSKYDIDPDRIQRGDDPRTTVMVRNLIGSRSRKDFLRFLERCDLHERYTFFYMPCKEHRNVPAGFAFVNFVAPADVHKLYVMVKSGFWREVMTDTVAKAPAVSYARFQGHEELAKHFNSSAVLHEQDPDKRPIFRLEVVKASKEPISQEDVSGVFRNAKVAMHSKKAAAEAAAGRAAQEQHGDAAAGADSAVGEELQAVLAKGVKEIAAILRRQEFQANPEVAVMQSG